VNGKPIRGVTNGDDAIIIGAENCFVAVNDGVGAWAQKERGHAALWSRLIAHFWGAEIEKSLVREPPAKLVEVDPVKSLDAAYEATKKATKGTLKRDPENEVYSESDDGDAHDNSSPGGIPSHSAKDATESKESAKNDILGTTTASSAILYHKDDGSNACPVILATTLGDCKVLVMRPWSESEREAQSRSEDESTGGTILYRSKEQWHWFDCPRQLGTNSPDTPLVNAVCETIDNIQLGDVVAVLSDGVTDNLWEHEICQNICDSIVQWQHASETPADDDVGRLRTTGDGDGNAKDGVVFVARRLMNAAREVAMDPNAESPYMERALDEGLAAEGGKLDDISVVIGIVRKRE
jgi:protein phosphatase PTC7